MAILLVLAAPTARNGMDVVNVRAARETAFALATRTRSVAQARGGAKIVFANLAGKTEEFHIADLLPRAFDARFLTKNK
jgi:hypothetical protein